MNPRALAVRGLVGHVRDTVVTTLEEYAIVLSNCDS
jgi:hypothetical protein